MKKLRTLRERLFSGGSRSAFTLAELLIVVAIIGILVAVSIPVFTTQLEKAKENTDIANLRAAKAAAVAHYLGNDETENLRNAESVSNVGVYYYDAESGILVSAGDDNETTHPVLKDIRGYGKGTAKDGGCDTFRMATRSVSSVVNDLGIQTENICSTHTPAANASGTAIYSWKNVSNADTVSNASGSADNNGISEYDGVFDVRNCVIKLVIHSDGCINMTWVDSSNKAQSGSGATAA